MKKVILFILISVFIFSGCKEAKPVQKSDLPVLSVEQVNDFKNKIIKVTDKKAWILEDTIVYKNFTLPNTVENTYYEEILKKSKDSGFDFSKDLGKTGIEGRVNIKYSNGDIAGVGHFIFIDDNLVGAYYMVGNYINSLNEKEVFTKNINWTSIENGKVIYNYEEIPLENNNNLIYSGAVNNVPYIFSFDNSTLKFLSIDAENKKFITNKEISLEGLTLVSMFCGNVDKDPNTEIGLLVSNNPKWWDKSSKSKLLIIEYTDKLKQEYKMDFDKPMWSIDFDGESIVATSENSIELLNIEENQLKKNYAYNKVGGIIRVGDIDNSNIVRYILRDSSGTDVYVFQKTKDGLEEIWRSYNTKSEFDGDIQIGDLNGDQIKEIYLKDYKNFSRKIILMESGFVDKNEDIKPGHRYFIGDFNNDKKYEYLDIYKNKNTKKIVTIYKF